MLNFCLSLLALYLLITALLYWHQEKFIFYPSVLEDSYHFPEYDNIEEIYYPVNDETRIHALHFKVNQPKGIVLFFHGNSQGLESWGYAAIDFTNRGYDVLMPDYRGYGKSRGVLSEKGLLEDARMVYDTLLQHWSAKDIILYGRSLGSGIACHLATQVPAKMVILETPYLSLVAMAKVKVPPIFPASLLLKFQLRNDLNISKTKCPVYIIHGTQDELIPYQHATRLNEIYGKDILTTIENGGHNNLGTFKGFQDRLDELLVN